MATPNTPANPERDATFWFFDGNIVLLAQGNIAFRVHKGILALHSEVFAGMFQQSLSAIHGHDDERIEGCPIIPLDDAAYDIRQLLRVMYGLNRLKTPDDTAFPIIAALVRVGHKYIVPQVVHECSLQLTPMVPATLNGYEKASKHRAAIKFTPRHALEALHVFRLIDLGANVPRTLAFLLFLCAQLTKDELRKGVPRSDSTLETLSDADIARVLALKKALQRRAEEILSEAEDFDGPADDCERYDSNEIYYDVAGCDVGYDVSPPRRVCDVYLRGEPFHPWVLERMYELERRNRVCGVCMEPKITRQEQLREAAWNALPRLAGLVE